VAKVTSKLQVTIPKAIAERYAIRPGDDVEWVPGADSVRVVPAKMLRKEVSIATRLKLFDAATERQRARGARSASGAGAERGWTREDLYERGGPR
jgi:AbrB family looped-hinge helix DNA binding protein